MLARSFHQKQHDFHPLVFFYFLGYLLLISGSQFMLFAMCFDMESNKDLGGRGRRRTD